MQKMYQAPRLHEYGDVTALTGTLGDPFTGDTEFDLDGSPLSTGLNSVDQCPTRDDVTCVPSTP